MFVPVRSPDSDEKLLFKWDNVKQHIEIVQKGKKFVFQLNSNGTYEPISIRSKATHTTK